MSSDRHRILKLHDEHVARRRDKQGPSFFRCRGAVSGAGGRFSLLVSVVYTPLPLVAGLEALFCLGSLLQGDESFSIGGYLHRIHLQSTTGSLRESQCVRSPQVEGGDSGKPRLPSGRWVVNRRVCFAFGGLMGHR